MPEAHKALEIEGSYTRDEYVTISQGLIPQSAQDKWFIYLEGEWLSFHRSASGSCIFKLKLTWGDEGVAATTLLVNQDPTQFKSDNDEYNLALVAYLIETLLLGRFAPFPQPKQLGKDDQARHQQHVMGKGDGSLQLRVVNGRGIHPPS